MTKKQFKEDSLKIVKPKFVRPQVRLDNRTIFYNNQRINISGFDLGVIFKDKLRMTLGYYQYSKNNVSFINKQINDVVYNGNYKLNYGALNMDFIYKNTRFFALGMPIEFGVGKNEIYYTNPSTEEVTEKEKGFVAMSYFGLSGTFKPIRWIGLKAAVGYRKTLMNQISNLKIDGIYSSIGLSIDFKEINKDIRLYLLKRKYKKGFKSLETAVDLFID